MGRGRQKATATCEATFEQVGKNTGTGGEKSKKRDVCVVGDGGKKTYEISKGKLLDAKTWATRGAEFWLGFGINTQFPLFPAINLTSCWTLSVVNKHRCAI